VSDPRDDRPLPDDEPLGAAPLGDAPLGDEPVDVEPVDVEPVDVEPVEVEGEPVEADPDAAVAEEGPLDVEALHDEGLPTGKELLASGASDDLDAPGPDPEAANPAAADSPSSRRDLLVVAAVVVLVVAVVTAFVLLRGGGEPAYTAFEQEVSREELRTRMEGLVDAELLPVVTDPESATDEQRAAIAQGMSLVIVLDVLSQVAEDRGVEVTEADVDAELESLIEEGFGGDRAAFDAQVEQLGVTQEAVRGQVRTQLLAEGLAADRVEAVEDADVQDAYDAQFTELVVSHILTETEEEAEEARQRVLDGEDFAAVASEVSIDPGSAQNGGELGPLVPGQFIPAFEEAAGELEPGDISEPVETEFGFHVITVDDPPTLEEVGGDIRQALEDQAVQAVLQELAGELDDEAMVTVDPAYGTWGGIAQGVVAPTADLPLPSGAPTGAPAEQAEPTAAAS
jgi:parvulin-like peptidyl-prolyl isomerase